MVPLPVTLFHFNHIQVSETGDTPCAQETPTTTTTMCQVLQKRPDLKVKGQAPPIWVFRIQRWQFPWVKFWRMQFMQFPSGKRPPATPIGRAEQGGAGHQAWVLSQTLIPACLSQAATTSGTLTKPWGSETTSVSGDTFIFIPPVHFILGPTKNAQTTTQLHSPHTLVK